VNFYHLINKMRAGASKQKRGGTEDAGDAGRVDEMSMELPEKVSTLEAGGVSVGDTTAVELAVDSGGEAQLPESCISQSSMGLEVWVHLVNHKYLRDSMASLTEA
jgi:hypothetical protein